jgi:hypothetical protein
VVGVATWDPSGATNSAFLINASDGTILATLDTGSSKVFGQMVFVGPYLFVPSFDNGMVAWTPAA